MRQVRGLDSDRGGYQAVLLPWRDPEQVVKPQGRSKKGQFYVGDPLTQSQVQRGRNLCLKIRAFVVGEISNSKYLQE